MRPSFWDSPYFIRDLDNWHLSDGAPEELKREFEDYMSHPDCVELKSEEEYIKVLQGKFVEVLKDRGY